MEEEEKKKNKWQEQEETISNFSTRDAEAPVQPQRHSFFFQPVSEMAF